MSVRCTRSGTSDGTYSPITSGRSTAKLSSIVSTSIVFMSRMTWRPLTGCAYGLPVSLRAQPRVGPAQPTPGVLLRDQRVRVRPGVHQYERQVGDAALGKGGNHFRRFPEPCAGPRATRRWSCSAARRVRRPKRHDCIVSQRDQRLVGHLLDPAPADHPGLARERGSGRREVPYGLLGRLLQLDRGKPPTSRRRPCPGAGPRPPVGSRRPTVGPRGGCSCVCVLPAGAMSGPRWSRPARRHACGRSPKALPARLGWPTPQ